jgi:uncharacterized protein (DUF2249 family)
VDCAVDRQSGIGAFPVEAGGPRCVGLDPGSFGRSHANIIATAGIQARTERSTMQAERDGTTRELDAREIDGEPFGRIMAALRELPEDGSLVLYNSFEPEPLYGVLENRGFSHETTRVSDDEWRVQITPA